MNEILFNDKFQSAWCHVMQLYGEMSTVYYTIDDREPMAVYETLHVYSEH